MTSREHGPNPQEAHDFRVQADTEVVGTRQETPEDSLENPEEQERVISDIHDGVGEYLAQPTQQQSESDPDGFKESSNKFAADYYKKFHEIAEQVKVLLEAGKFEETEVMVQEFVTEIKDQVPEYFTQATENWFRDYEAYMSQQSQSHDETTKQKFFRLAIEALDFVPVIGSIKMMSEGVAGKTMSGNALGGKHRVFRTAEGAAFLALDLTGVGLIGKGGVAASKLLTRSAALSRKLGMPRKVSQSMFRTGMMLKRNPAYAKAADKFIETLLVNKQIHYGDWTRRVGREFLEDQETE